MTDPTHETEPEQTPLSLVQRLRLQADDLTSTWVATDAHGDPIERPGDGTEEADFDDPSDPVEFEPEQLHNLARLYREAADALEEARMFHEQANAEIARLTAELGAPADPPNRAFLLGQLESWGRGEYDLTTGELINDVTAAIRTDARVIEAQRTNLKAWHGWARKIGRAEGDEYASAMPATLQARIAGQVEAGQLALLVEPIRRRVELALALCEDMGLGGPEAAELAPKAALWTDAEVAEIEAFRMKDWSDTGLNPFDHLPAALERTVYPNGGRRAYLKRAGEPLPPEAPAPVEHQLGLPGMPKPETALRLRLALIDKPDGPLAALVAGFAQALLEKLEAAHKSRDLAEDDHPWMHADWVEDLRRQLREHVGKGDPRNVAAYCAFAWHHGWSLADRHAHLDQVDRDILAAKPEDRANVLLEGLQRHMETVGSMTADSRDQPAPPGYTPWISMGNTGWALDGVRVADDVIGAWAHYAGLWTSWARELAGCSDGTDEELRGYIARLVGRMHTQRGKNLAELDSPQ